MSQVSQQQSLFTYGASRELKPRVSWRVDPLLLTITLLLLSFSIVMVYSTTGVISQERFGDALYYVKRQTLAAILGLTAMAGLSQVPIKILKQIAPYCFGIAVFLLVCTHLPFLGDSAGGAQRWVNLRIVRFQPGELVKLLAIIHIAGYLSRQEKRLGEFFTGVAKPVLMVGVLAVLYLKQPDFGSAAVVTVITLLMTASAGASLIHLGLSSIALVVPAVLLVITSPYRMKRIAAFLSPLSDPSGSGYQLIQSLIAIGTGNIAGVGLGSGQQKLFFLPAAHTDFIFAVVGEELGLIGCVALILVFLAFLYRGMQLAGKVSGDVFSFSLILGLTLLIVLPALLNAGVVTGLLPTKGMVLPLVGYGGSSIISCLMAVGIILSVSRQQR